MSSKVFQRDEGFPALLAFVGLLSAVFSLMRAAVREADEGFPTVSASVLSLSGVNLLVYTEV